ncbi:MAG: Fe-S protein assembly co-chaperone HscB [Sorangiineae bacterium NIC37A_2]|nr:MAG: Fe-S protein assembly co-chaperone HscB [Sorangiineae bacterium NIC37A_2]
MWLWPLVYSQVTDPFQLLGLPRTYSLDRRELDEKHKKRSLELHPDRLRGRSPVERRQALSLAIEVNQAYRTLRDPAARALSLASLLGLTVGGEESRSADPAFLMQMMELREELTALRSKKDRSGVERQIQRARAEARQAEEALGRAFEKEKLDAAEIEGWIGKLRYWARFLEEAELISDDLEVSDHAPRHL